VGRYPVKSMRGESLPAAVLTLQGIPVDRRYAFVQGSSRSSFPWLTARELPELLRYHTSVDKTQPQEVELTVTTPSGEKFRINCDELRKILEARAEPSFCCMNFAALLMCTHLAYQPPDDNSVQVVREWPGADDLVE